MIATRTQPLYAETARLLECVEHHDLDALRGCIAAFSTIDVDAGGNTAVLATAEAWEAAMAANFALMRDLGATVSHAITAYHGATSDTLGTSVVRFRQTVQIGAGSVAHDCLATVLWRQEADGWKQTHWHCSLVHTDDAAAHGQEVGA